MTTTTTDTTSARPSICYIRVSTADQAASGLGIEAQTDRTTAYAVAQGYQPHSVVVDDGVSGSVAPDDRPGLSGALAALDAGDASVLVVSAISRLGRSAADVLVLAERAERRGWSLAVLDLGFDTATINGRLMLTVLAGLARWERDIARERTIDALAAAKRRGQRLGGPVSPATRQAAPIIERHRAAGLTWQQIADRLTADGQPTATGRGVWSITQARRAVATARLDAEAAAARGDIIEV